MDICKCGQEKTNETCAKRADGRWRSRCRKCEARLAKERRDANPELYKQRSRDHYARNRSEQIARSTKWAQDNYDKKTNAHLLRNYNITLEQYDSLFNTQNGVCAVCKKPETAVDRRTNKIRRLHVDHCHTTGKVRGLLCTKCNIALGYLDDDIQILNSLIQYIKDSI